MSFIGLLALFLELNGYYVLQDLAS